MAGVGVAHWHSGLGSTGRAKRLGERSTRPATLVFEEEEDACPPIPAEPDGARASAMSTSIGRGGALGEGRASIIPWTVRWEACKTETSGKK